ncbi:MAG: phytanoyl-CoA dioxygenase family protein [Acidimicrobiales bacterium]|nr:phytanoyl-CoA dioxygenase family protein [Acidimicrobiales bacterium]
MTLEPTYRHVPRLAVGSAESIEHLESEGFVVLASALDPDQTAHAVELTWAFLEGLGTGIDRCDPATWADDRWPVAVHGGIIPSQGIGHSEAQWFIRSVPAVKEAFAAVWGDHDLLVSFDGMAIWRPTAVDENWRTTRGSSWLHIDQHPIGRPGFHCVQGLVSLLPTSPVTGGNVVVPGSHRFFESIPDRYTDRLARIAPSIDHFRFPADDPQLESTPPIMPHLEPGDLLLWDSRTIHCSSPALADESVAEPALLRIASLVCMMPKSRSNPEVIQSRRAALRSRTSTTNWSDRFINADRFPDVLAASDREFVLPPAPALTAEQDAMVG